ncbi:MAG: hypothetical protein Q9219_004112 [cf. Caloplaca sp. 3 TL-2023]
MALNSEVKVLIEQIAGVGSDLAVDGPLPPEIRKKLQGLVKELGFASETLWDTMNRLAILPLQHQIVRVAINLGLSEYLIEAGPGGRTVEEIGAKTGVDQLLLPRLLRALATIGLLTQIDQTRWAATPRAQACTMPASKSGLKFMFDFIHPVFQKLPESLAKNSYRCPSALEGPLQDTYQTKMSGYDFIMEPQWADTLKDCNLFMKGRREGSVPWLDFYHFGKNIPASTTEDMQSVLVVDVGGGLGHGLVEIKTRFPTAKGRLILQDLENTIEQAGDGDGIFESTIHDFFTPQPVIGSKVYLMRQVLHDWPDKECKIILSNLAAAMRPGYSRLLVNEIIVPEVGAGEFIIACDLIMMGLSGGMERTESHWTSLLSSVGLRIEKIWTLDDQTESVIEAVLA